MSASIDYAKHYAEVRKRLNAGTFREVVVKIHKPEPVVEDEPAAPEVPAWRQCYEGPIGPVPERDVLCIATRRTGKQIVLETAIKHGITVETLMGDQRHKRFVYARHEAMWRIWTELQWSFVRIGQYLGGRDHTTVMHGVRAHAARTGGAA